MKRIISILFALALVLTFSLVATTPVAAQTTYYVDDSGSNLNGGTSWGDAWLTIQHAVDTVLSGDTIMVGAGTYFGATVNKDVTIQANPGDTVIINDGPNTHSFLRAGFYLPGDYSGNGATISGFHIVGANQASFIDDGQLDFGIFSRGANGVTVENNIITDMLQAITNWNGSNWLIDNNQITDLWTLNGGGIGILIGANNGSTVSGNVISNNQISGTLSVYSGDGGGYDGTGIVLYADFRGTNTGGIVTGNTISGNDIGMVSDTPGVVNFNGIELSDTRDSDLNPASIYGNQVVQNNVHDNSGNGLLVTGGTSDNHINDNNIAGNQGYGVLYSGTGTLDATNNWWGDASGPTHASNPSGTGDAVSDNVDFGSWRQGPLGAVGWDTYAVNRVHVLLPWIALLAVIAGGASLLVLRRRRVQS